MRTVLLASLAALLFAACGQRDAPPSDVLPSWTDRPARQRISTFVEAATEPGGKGYIDVADRIAVFDNDGTLWCEKPLSQAEARGWTVVSIKSDWRTVFPREQERK